MSIVNGPKINTMVSAANGDTYGDGERHQLRTQQALIQANVKSLALSTPPGSPSNGDTYIVGGSPTGAWTGFANYVAYWAIDTQDGTSITPNINTGAWEFYAPVQGWQVFDQNTGAAWRYNGSAWVLASSLKVPVSPVGGVVTCNPAIGNNFRINVNTAVTSVVISNGVSDGQEITLLWVQSGTNAVSGFSANIHGATTPSSTGVSSQRFTWDSGNSIWYALSAGVTGM